MKATALFLLACLTAVFGKEVGKFNEVDNMVVCANRKKTLELTILQGADGKTGPTGPQGKPGEDGAQGDSGPSGPPGDPGFNGMPGATGPAGETGDLGYVGDDGLDGLPGLMGMKGEGGEPGPNGLKGEKGYIGETGMDGPDGEPGEDGTGPRLEEIKGFLIHALNAYQVAENGYYNRLYHVTARDLTDGRTDTGGWGSATAKTGNYIQATYASAVYVTSVTVAGGYIPSWSHDIKQGYAKLALEYSFNGKEWTMATIVNTPDEKKMLTKNFSPITAQYWRLRSYEDKWAGTTEFALKPLIKGKDASKLDSSIFEGSGYYKEKRVFAED